MSDLIFKAIGLDQFPGIYSYIKTDFSDQYAPYRIYADHLINGASRCYVLLVASKLAGYALAFSNYHYPFKIIWHLAVLPEHRGQGFGSRMLADLSREYRGEQGILIEVDRPQDAKNEADHQERLHRIQFYEQNGYRMLPHHWTLHGLPYRLMFCNTDPEVDHFEQVRETADMIYRCFYPPQVPVVFFEEE